MSRVTTGVDRVVALVVGLALLAGGALTVVWGTRQVSRLAGPVNASSLRHATGESWWPWAVGGTGAAVALLGLIWWWAHVPRHGVGRLQLPGSGRSGRLLAESRPIADAAATALEPTLGVRRARGRVRRERGRLVLRIDALLDPDADLTVVSDATDQVSGQVRRMLGRDDLTCQVRLRVATGVAGRPRVR